MLRRCFLHCASRSSGFGAGCDLTRLAYVGHARLQPMSTSANEAAQSQQQQRTVDPFTSAMQNKTEKELMDQMLREAEEQERAEDAAEQVRIHERGEHGGPKGQEPTRFGDWEKGGRCYDF